MRVPLPLRLALRDLRGGLAGFRILLACLLVGVAAIAAVGSVRAAIEAGLAREAAALLGGDAQIEFSYRFADPDERAWMETHASAVSETVDFRSLATTTGPDGEAARTLVQVKAVDAGYPLFGVVSLADGGTLASALTARDGRPGIVAERLLVERLGLRPGDDITLGTQTFRLADTIDSLPDAGGGFSFGPRVVVLRADLESSGLLSEGSLFDSAYRLRLAPDADLAALKAEATADFGERGLQWRDRRDGAPGVGRFVDRLSTFLILLGLAGLAVGGIGIAAAVRAHLDSRVPTIATLKTLGARRSTVFATYFLQIGLVTAGGIAGGLVLGALLPLAAGPLIGDRLPVPPAFGLYDRPLIKAALYGTLTALTFGLWPLARVLDIRPAALFRDDTGPGRRWPRPGPFLATGLCAALLVAAATRFSGAPTLALATAGGVAAALLVLALAAAGLVALARRTGHTRLARGRPALRWALAAIGTPGGETREVVLALGLGLAVLATVGQIDTNLRTLVTRELPTRAPAFFFVDIQNDQLPDFLERATAVPGVGEIETAPMLRGVISRINGRPAIEVAGPHWVLSGDRGISYAAIPPPGTTLTEGSWWPADYSGPPQMSFSEEEGRELGLRLGDTLTVNVLGRDITATITSFRKVAFQTMGINFVMIVDPASLAGAPHTHIATAIAAPAAEGPLLRAVADAYPNVTAIGVREAIGRVAATLDGIAAATRVAASLTLLTGLLVLIGAAAGGMRARIQEAAILKTIGATRARILASFALRAALTGAAAGMIAIAAGMIGGFLVMHFVFDAAYVPDPRGALLIVAGGAITNLVAGLLFAARPLAVRPARVLRARD